MITGFYVADLARRGKHSIAEKYLAGIHRSNAMVKDGRSWSFPEYVNGNNFSPGGTANQCWSASAALMGHYAMKGEKVFSIHEDLTSVQ